MAEANECRGGRPVSLPTVHPAAELFPLMSDEELSELSDDVKSNGLLEPVWDYVDPESGQVLLLDGRNRWLACERAGVVPKKRRYEGDDPVGFAVSLNLTRRHLTTGQKAAVAHDSLPLYEAEAERRKVAAGRAYGRGQSKSDEQVEADRPQPVKRAPQARDRAAKAAGTSGRSVARYKRIAEVAPDLADSVKGGSMALDRAERIVRDREAQDRKIAKAKAEAEAQPVPTSVDIRHGDFREVLADLQDVDAIITDPPYPREFLPLLGDMAAWADKVLAEDGIMAVLIGQTHLPEVYRLLDGHRAYRWTGCYLTPGAGYVSHPRKVQSNWKPLIVYGGGPRFSDTFSSEGSDADAKGHHKWGQDYSAFHAIVERLTDRGQTVVDPFMGSGTTLLAAHALGRNCIGADVDLDSVETALRRLA